MTYPRLLTEGTSAERRLLSAALADRPAKETQAQVLAKLGLGLGVATVPSSTTHLAQPFSPFVHWVGITGLAIGVGVVTTLVAHSFGGTISTRPNVTLPNGAPAVAPLVIANTTSRTVLDNHEIATKEVTCAIAEPTTTLPLPSPKAPTTKPQNLEPGNESVGLEVRLVDAARRALQAGMASTCLTKLDERKRRVGIGMLEPEATLLRVQARLALGQPAAAEREAHRYLEQQPESPIATRIRRALARADDAP